MQKQTAADLCAECVRRIHYRGKRATVENPAMALARNEKRGRLRGMPDDLLADMRAEAEEASGLWGGKSRRAAGAVLVDILAGCPGARHSRLSRVADALSDLLADEPDDKGAADGDPADDWVPDDVAAAAAGADMELPFPGASPVPFPERSPAEIRDVIAGRVLGRRSNSVFAGPSGCGKSEIWRVLAREYPGLVRVVDFSRFASEGWAGSLHVRDIFEGMDMQSFQQYGI